MRPNRIKTVWNEGRVATNVFLGIPDSFAAEIISSLDWDGVTIDMLMAVAHYE